ncbi:MAG: molecular chaperone [Bacteroidota bacterium]|nr:molecular chaperone [Bacteroidota bacterium]
MRPILKTIALGATILLLTITEFTTIYAQGGALMVNPKRCVFEGNKRNDVVTLYNDGDDTSSYAISFRHYEMGQNGEFKDIDSIKTDDLFCDQMVKFFPREVTLPPHGVQTIRLQLLKPKDLAPGEYRSHLYFRSIERSKALEYVRHDTEKTITLNLKAIYGLAIPVIVRHNTTQPKITLSNLTLSPADTEGNALLSVDIGRSGSESSYGEFILSYKDASTNETELTRVKGVGVYVPLEMRRFTMRFKMPGVVRLSTGILKLEYKSMTGEAKESTLALAQMSLMK